MTDYNDGKWHGYNGEGCPVHPETVVEVVHRNTGVLPHRRAAITSWLDDNLIAFRVIKEHREPLQTWMKQNEYGDLVECGFDEPGAVLFREVLE